MSMQAQGAFCVKFTPKIHDCTPTFIINYIMIFETPHRKSSAYGTSNAPWMQAQQGGGVVYVGSGML